jgi:hypothetical protein
MAPSQLIDSDDLVDLLLRGRPMLCADSNDGGVRGLLNCEQVMQRVSPCTLQMQIWHGDRIEYYGTS